MIEGISTSALVFTSGQIGVTLQGYDIKQIGAYVGISNIALLSIFIYATAPASGGHLSPTITFAAILSGICPLARGEWKLWIFQKRSQYVEALVLGVLYLLGQTLGSALAGWLLAGTLGEARAEQ